MIDGEAVVTRVIWNSRACMRGAVWRNSLSGRDAACALGYVRAVSDMRMIMIRAITATRHDGLQPALPRLFLNLMITRIKDTDRRLLSILWHSR